MPSDVSGRFPSLLNTPVFSFCAGPHRARGRSRRDRGDSLLPVAGGGEGASRRPGLGTSQESAVPATPTPRPEC